MTKNTHSESRKVSGDDVATTWRTRSRGRTDAHKTFLFGRREPRNHEFRLGGLFLLYFLSPHIHCTMQGADVLSSK